MIKTSFNKIYKVGLYKILSKIVENTREIIFGINMTVKRIFSYINLSLMDEKPRFLVDTVKATIIVKKSFQKLF